MEIEQKIFVDNVNHKLRKFAKVSGNLRMFIWPFGPGNLQPLQMMQIINRKIVTFNIKLLLYKSDFQEILRNKTFDQKKHSQKPKNNKIKEKSQIKKDSQVE